MEELLSYGGGSYPRMGQIVYFGRDFKDAGIALDLYDKFEGVMRVFVNNSFQYLKIHELRYIKWDILESDNLEKIVGNNMDESAANSINYYSDYTLKNCLKIYLSKGGYYYNSDIASNYTIEDYIQRQKEDKFWSR